MPAFAPLETRFFRYVKKTASCWLWTGNVSDQGYGRIQASRQHKILVAHRVSWELHLGPIPKGMDVLHKCDNPPCVNPAHLFIGTHTDNMRDMKNKGRLVVLFGEDSHFAKLTASQVRKIRKLYGYRGRGGLTLQELGSRYGVSPSAIWLIVHGKKWKELLPAKEGR